MSRNRPRTGLAKPREFEREMREVNWRESGGAISGISDREALERRHQLLVASEAFGFDVTAGDQPRNALVELLLLAQLASAETDADDCVFARAIEQLRRIGCGGPDGIEKLKLMLPSEGRNVVEGDTAFEAFMLSRTATGSAETALEEAAVKFAVPSSSFRGAVQALKRKWMKMRRR